MARYRHAHDQATIYQEAPQAQNAIRMQLSWHYPNWLEFWQSGVCKNDLLCWWCISHISSACDLHVMLYLLNNNIITTNWATNIWAWVREWGGGGIHECVSLWQPPRKCIYHALYPIDGKVVHTLAVYSVCAVCVDHYTWHRSSPTPSIYLPWRQPNTTLEQTNCLLMVVCSISVQHAKSQTQLTEGGPPST